MARKEGGGCRRFFIKKREEWGVGEREVGRERERGGGGKRVRGRERVRETFIPTAIFYTIQIINI